MQSQQPPSVLLLLPLIVVVSLAQLPGAAEAQLSEAGVAYLRVAGQPSSSYENYCTYMDPKVARNLTDHYAPGEAKQLLDLYPSNGCENPLNASSRIAGFTVIVARGGCTFLEKAVNAARRGATGLVIVSSERYQPYLYLESPLLPRNYPVSIVSIVAYRSMKSQFLQTSSTATWYRPTDSGGGGSKQYMFLALYAVALGTMILACVSAATALRQHLLTRARLANSNLNNADGGHGDADDSSTASWWQTAIFIVILIAVPVTILLLLNFAYDYTVWVMLVLYGYSVAGSLVYYANRFYLTVVQAQVESGHRPWLATTVELNLGKCCGKISYTYLEFLAYPVGLAIAIVWFVFRNAHWAFILTNLMNVVLVLRVIESLAFVLRIKLATIVLVCFLVYDVFFVFITPLFSGGGGSGGSQQPLSTVSPTTAPAGGALSRVRRDTVMDYYIDRGGSIMERVALGTAGLSGEVIPIVFKVMPYPPIESIATCLLPYSILGLGDVILPAILLSLNLFFDLAWSNRFWPYFLSSLAGYLGGLAICAGVLFSTGKGQPALLYIVPMILIASYICAAIRRELKLYFYTSLPDEYRVISGFDIDTGPGANHDNSEQQLQQQPRLDSDSSGEPDQKGRNESVG